MQLKKSSLVLIALATVLMTSTGPSSLVSAQITGIDIIGGDPAATSNPTSPPSQPSPSHQPSPPPPPPPTTTTEAPVPPPVTSAEPPAASSTTAAVIPPPAISTNGGGRRTTTVAVVTGTRTDTMTSTGTALPSQTKTSEGGTGGSLATAGIVVGSVIVAAAIGIWVFRKWKLSPSREFQSKINGDDYTDYPRSYESDAVFLRNLGDQPAEPAPTKSPYHAAGGLPAPVEDQYYDSAAYDQHQTAGAYHSEGYGYDHNGYDHQAGGGYDYQTGYDQLGYDNGAYAHADYAQSQVSGGSQVGGYGGSQVGAAAAGGYGGATGGSQVGGYAQSNVGGGYQHQGYDEYGRR